VAPQNSPPLVRAIWSRKIFAVCQTAPRLLPKPECDDREGVKRECTWAQDGRSEL
jgi:hypothetical protein